MPRPVLLDSPSPSRRRDVSLIGPTRRFPGVKGWPMTARTEEDVDSAVPAGKALPEAAEDARPDSSRPNEIPRGRDEAPSRRPPGMRNCGPAAPAPPTLSPARPPSPGCWPCRAPLPPASPPAAAPSPRPLSVASPGLRAVVERSPATLTAPAGLEAIGRACSPSPCGSAQSRGWPRRGRSTPERRGRLGPAVTSSAPDPDASSAGPAVWLSDPRRPWLKPRGPHPGDGGPRPSSHSPAGGAGAASPVGPSPCGSCWLAAVCSPSAPRPGPSCACPSSAGAVASCTAADAEGAPPGSLRRDTGLPRAAAAWACIALRSRMKETPTLRAGRGLPPRLSGLRWRPSGRDHAPWCSPIRGSIGGGGLEGRFSRGEPLSPTPPPRPPPPSLAPPVADDGCRATAGSCAHP
mmetsp:Transcript_2431/g.9566  ORF Transcript_2431/g.9566 Transcript_2431/m.9566 type:complete len:406 (+) Transcript_2431:1396-2613(+)